MKTQLQRANTRQRKKGLEAGAWKKIPMPRFMNIQNVRGKRTNVREYNE